MAFNLGVTRLVLALYFISSVRAMNVWNFYFVGDDADLICDIHPSVPLKAHKEVIYSISRVDEHYVKTEIFNYNPSRNTSLQVEYRSIIKGRATFKRPVLHWNKLRKSDSGNYLCETFHQGESHEMYFNLQINAVPIISLDVYEDPKPATRPGYFEVAKCRSLGTVALTSIDWIDSKTETKQPSGSTRGVQGKLHYSESTLYIAPVPVNANRLKNTDSLKKEYKCQVLYHLSKKKLYLRSASVKLPYNPRHVEVKMRPTIVHEYDKVVLTCSAESWPPSNYTWTKNGRAIGTGPKHTILNITREEVGSYTCTATNGLSSDGISVTAALKYMDSDTDTITAGESDEGQLIDASTSMTIGNTAAILSVLIGLVIAISIAIMLYFVRRRSQRRYAVESEAVISPSDSTSQRKFTANDTKRDTSSENYSPRSSIAEERPDIEIPNHPIDTKLKVLPVAVSRADITPEIPRCWQQNDTASSSGFNSSKYTRMERRYPSMVRPRLSPLQEERLDRYFSLPRCAMTESSYLPPMNVSRIRRCSSQDCYNIPPMQGADERGSFLSRFMVTNRSFTVNRTSIPSPHQDSGGLPISETAV